MVDTDYPIEHAAKTFIFNPLTLVILGSLFIYVAYAFNYRPFASKRLARFWVYAYGALAFTFSSGYFIFFAVDDNPPLLYESVWVTCLGFGFLALSPLIAGELSRQVLYKYSGRFATPLVYAVFWFVCFVVMLVGLSGAISTDIFSRSAISVAMGLSGLGIAPAMLKALKQ